MLGIVVIQSISRSVANDLSFTFLGDAGKASLLVMKTGCHYSTPDWTVIMPRANSVFWLARFCPRQIDSCFNLNCRSLRRIHGKRNNSVVRAFRIWISLVAFRTELLANLLSELFVLRNKLEVNDNYSYRVFSSGSIQT